MKKGRSTEMQNSHQFCKLFQLKNAVVGDERKTMISLDMRLYLKAKMLDLNKPSHLGPGELHIVMAMLKAIGAVKEVEG